MKSVKAASLALIVVLGLAYSYKGAVAGGLEFVRNLHLGSWSPFAAYWEGRSPVCAWTESEEIGFRIIALDQNNSNTFRLTNDIGDQVPFSLFWQDYNNPNSGEQLVAGRPSRNFYSFNSGNGCGISPNYLTRMRVDKADFDGVTPGVYESAVLLMLSPI